MSAFLQWYFATMLWIVGACFLICSFVGFFFLIFWPFFVFSEAVATVVWIVGIPIHFVIAAIPFIGAVMFMDWTEPYWSKSGI